MRRSRCYARATPTCACGAGPSSTPSPGKRRWRRIRSSRGATLERAPRPARSCTSASSTSGLRRRTTRTACSISGVARTTPRSSTSRTSSPTIRAPGSSPTRCCDWWTATAPSATSRSSRKPAPTCGSIIPRPTGSLRAAPPRRATQPGPPARRKVEALFGGSFDPVHLGHLVVAETLADVLGVTVRFLPAREQPFKHAAHAASPEQRAEMLALAVAGNPRFRVERVELELPTPSYTVRTLRALAGRDPGNRFVLLLGADAAGEPPHLYGVGGPADPAARLAVCRPGGARAADGPPRRAG